MSRAYLLLDSCQIENLNARLFERAPGAAPHALYLMTQYAELAAYGPVLIAVETGSHLVRPLFNNGSTAQVSGLSPTPTKRSW